MFNRRETISRLYVYNIQGLNLKARQKSTG